MQPERNSRMPWTILSGAVLLSFAMWAPMFSVPPMEHIIKEELLLTHAQTSLLYSIPILMIGVIAIPAGLITDRIGFRKAAGIGAIIIALGSILRGTATDFSSLLAFTFIYGAGLGWTWPTLPKLVSVWVPREKAGVATGIYTSGMFAGAALAVAITMPLVFPITNTFQGTFFIWSIPTVAAAILWWILVKEPPRNKVNTEPATRWNASLHRLLRNKNLWLLSILFLLECFFIYTWLGWSPALLMLKGGNTRPGRIYCLDSHVGNYPRCFPHTQAFQQTRLEKTVPLDTGYHPSRFLLGSNIHRPAHELAADGCGRNRRCYLSYNPTGTTYRHDA